MKQKIIKTDKVTLLLVETENIDKNEDGYWLPNNEGGYMHIPFDQYQLLGRLPDITEGDLYTLGFRADNLSSILDKLEHLVIKNNIYFKNIYGETKPLHPWQDLIESEGLHVNYKHRLKLWSEAQSKVWDKDRTYLFIKVG